MTDDILKTKEEVTEAVKIEFYKFKGELFKYFERKANARVEKLSRSGVLGFDKKFKHVLPIFSLNDLKNILEVKDG